MIDLSNAKVGDKFLSFISHTYELKLLNKKHDDYVLVSDRGCIQMVDKLGKTKEEDCTFHLVSKIDTRHWLGKLPDADLLLDGWLSFNPTGNKWQWHDAGCHDPEPRIVDNNTRFTSGVISRLSAFAKMPTLTGDEWKQSKISIPDLRAWQKENKAFG